ncbi:competence protein CoiA family protein [Psychrobacillus sp. FSL H8-0483]|uniref:DUF3895 domain-containing protein n=1 Tax=Psychrobacillus sp. FSL H8-0483 TaxID=2921389 RepID=UPI00315A0BAB
MREAHYEGKNFDLVVYLESKSNTKEIEKLKKRADKGAFSCPYCNETLIIRSGEIREVHFAHRHSKSCAMSVASEVYQKQLKGESKRHSVMKDIIHDELKSQEKINTDLHVNYGYMSKAEEKWKYYPDIIINFKGKESAISILSEVTSNKDEQLVKRIKNRNRYFKRKNLETVWFVENTEQSIDMAHHVIHLWEAELDIASKTAEDRKWEDCINTLSPKYPLFELFDYHNNYSPVPINVRSLYYISSTDTNIVFSVQRFIQDQDKYPFRAFALNEAYQMSLSTALRTTVTLQLSDQVMENKQRQHFIQEVKEKETEYIAKQQEEEVFLQTAAAITVNDSLKSNFSITSTVKPKRTPLKSVQQLKDIKPAINSFIRHNSVFSATEVCEFLVLKCGASQDSFSTGRYKIYPEVCTYLEILVSEHILKLESKNFVNERVYRVV